MCPVFLPTTENVLETSDVAWQLRLYGIAAFLKGQCRATSDDR
jgi:hypothetical protein